MDNLAVLNSLPTEKMNLLVQLLDTEFEPLSLRRQEAGKFRCETLVGRINGLQDETGTLADDIKEGLATMQQGLKNLVDEFQEMKESTTANYAILREEQDRLNERMESLVEWLTDNGRLS
jgi:DNA repair exonuclease SbcCD ATPase subunit